jgi:hypothetical protein
LKLLLSGYEPEDSDEDNFPFRLPGIDKPLTTRSVRGYYSAELFHYYDFYQKVKQYGLPFKNFLECPAWVLQLQDKFDAVYREMELHFARAADTGGRDTAPRSRPPRIRRR